MYSFKQLQSEINAKIEWLRQHNGSTLHPDWITNSVMSDHQDIHGEDADFHLCCTRLSVRKEVTQQINMIASRKNTGQGILEGFDHLQEFYVVERDNTRVGVAVQDLTDAELDQKANEYDSMGRACMEHADELRRFKEIRRSAA